MVHSNGWLWLLVSAFYLGACGSQRDPSPPLKACNASNCDVVAIVAGGSTGGFGAGADSGMNTSGISLSVDVVQFTGSTTGVDAWSPQNVAQLGGTFTVKVSAASGGVLSAVDGSPLAFTNALADGNGWVSVTPGTSSGFWPGLHGIPLDTGTGVSVPLLRISDLDFVPALLSTKVLTVDTTKAQLVIKFTDSSGKGVSGLRVSNMGGDAMAYASLGNWVDSNTNISASTDTSGRVIGINIPASTSPGLLAYVSATGLNLQGVTQSVAGTFPILAGYVTYGTIRFQ